MSDFLNSILFDTRLTQAGAALVGAFIGVLGSLLVTIAAGLLNRDRYKRDRLWEKRQEACNTVVSELQATAPIAETIRDGFSEDPHRFWGSQQLADLNKRYWSHTGPAHLAFQQNYLILPAPFRKRYERMLRERNAWTDAADPDLFLGPIEADERAFRDLFDIALSTLGIAPFWRRQWLKWRPGWRRLPHLFRLMFRRAFRLLKRMWRRTKRGQSNDW